MRTLLIVLIVFASIGSPSIEADLSVDKTDISGFQQQREALWEALDLDLDRARIVAPKTLEQLDSGYIVADRDGEPAVALSWVTESALSYLQHRPSGKGHWWVGLLLTRMPVRFDDGRVLEPGSYGLYLSGTTVDVLKLSVESIRFGTPGVKVDLPAPLVIDEEDLPLNVELSPRGKVVFKLGARSLSGQFLEQ